MSYSVYEPPTYDMMPSLDVQAQEYNWTPEYKSTQEDLGAIRALMAQQGAGYMVTGAGSLDNGGDTTAYLPQLLQQANIGITPGIAQAYQGVTGQQYKPGSQTAYNPQTQGYDVTGGVPQAQPQAPAPQQVQQPQQAPQMAPQAPQTAAGVGNGMFGGGSATAGRPQEQLATIKGTWDQYMWGMKTAEEVMQAMTQYGVNFADIEAATGYPAQVAQALLQKGSTANKPSDPNPTSKPVSSVTPYNPNNIAVSTNGQPAGFTGSPTGMVNLQTGADTTQAMNDYYSAYFGGAKPDQGLLSNWYSSSYSPKPTGFSNSNKGASSASGMVNSLDWGTPQLDAKSTPELYKYMTTYGLTPKNVADAFGFTEQQVKDHFKQYGIDVSTLGKAAEEVVDNSATGDGPQRSGNNRSGI